MNSMSSSMKSFGAIPTVNARTLGLMFVAGFVATCAFDFWGQVVSPSWLGWANLSPHGLAKSLLGALGLPNNDFVGYFMHFYLVGQIGYPVGWLFLFAPLWARVVGPTHWAVPGLIYGFCIFLFAIGGITAIAGLPFFLNFTGITWVAMIGHVMYGFLLVATLQVIDRT